MLCRSQGLRVEFKLNQKRSSNSEESLVYKNLFIKIKKNCYIAEIPRVW